jgi:putative (di)nucleoside polyphosphate hydrolase
VELPLTAEKRFRKNVAALVLNERGQILACERSDIDGAWQFPQGGVERGEEIEEALSRELAEEIGLKEFDLLGSLPESICYDWPPSLFKRGYHGQEQHYFLVRARVPIDFGAATSREFRRCEWVSASELRKRLSGFKAAAYTTALDQFERLFPGVIER